MVLGLVVKALVTLYDKEINSRDIQITSICCGLKKVKLEFTEICTTFATVLEDETEFGEEDSDEDFTF